MELICKKCHTKKIVNDEKISRFEGRTISTKCANKTCDNRIKFKVPNFQQTKQANPSRKKSKPNKVRLDEIDQDSIFDTFKNPKKKTKQQQVKPKKQVAENPDFYQQKVSTKSNESSPYKKNSGIILLGLIILIDIVAITALNYPYDFNPELVILISIPTVLILSGILLLSETKQNGVKVVKYHIITRIIAFILLILPLIPTLYQLLNNYFNGGYY
jgi:hypothetical protein